MSDTNTVIQLEELSDTALIEICRAAEVIACECPGYLARILRQVRVFRDYTTNCIEQFPADAKTHEWLASRASQVEEILYQTMIELMQKEGLMDDSHQILLNKISERARATMLKQIGSDTSCES